MSAEEVFGSTAAGMPAFVETPHHLAVWSLMSKPCAVRVDPGPNWRSILLDQQFAVSDCDESQEESLLGTHQREGSSRLRSGGVVVSDGGSGGKTLP